MGGRWLEGGSVVSWVGLLAVRQVEEGGTRMDLDDDDDAMDIDKDNAIVHATAGGTPPPLPRLVRWSGQGSCRATTTTGRPLLLRSTPRLVFLSWL